MTVPSTARRAGPYLGNGVTTSFPFTFKVFAKSDISLTLTNTAGISTALVLDSDYSVTLNVDQDSNPGGTITYPISGSPMAAGYKLTGVGAIPYDQATSFPDGGAYRASTTEDTFDRTVFQIQQLAEAQGRSLALPASAEGADPSLPSPSPNSLLGWNADGTRLQNVDAAAMATIVAFGTSRADMFTGNGVLTQFTLSSNPGAQANLDVSMGGVTQYPSIDYTWTGGTTLTFTSAPPNGVQILVRYFQGLPQGYSDAAASTWVDNGGGTQVVQSALQRMTGELVSVQEARFGAVAGGVVDSSAAINLALASGAQIVHGGGKTYKINSAVTIPAGVTLRDIKLVAGTPGMNMVLVSSGCRVENVKLRGTGTLSTVERAIYPAVDGVTGLHIDAEVENITVGVHICPLSSITPSLNFISVYVHDIVGTTGASEGYGVLLSPANDNQVFVRAKNIKRHALYLSAGASRNKCWVNVDTCYHNAVSVFSTSAQPACVDNELWVDAVNVVNAPSQTTLAVALGLTQKVERTRAYVTCSSSGGTDHAVKVEGVGTASGPWPTNNKIHVRASGTYLGSAVALSIDADNTEFVEPIIEGKAAVSLVQLSDSGGNTYTPKRAGCVRGGVLDGLDNTQNGVAITANRGAVDVGGSIKFHRVLTPVFDNTGKRMGVNKQFAKTVQFTNVVNNGSASTVITLPESFDTNTLAAHAQVTSASSPGDGLEAVIDAYNSTSVTVRAWNRSGSTQAIINVTVWVTGD